MHARHQHCKNHATKLHKDDAVITSHEEKEHVGYEHYLSILGTEEARDHNLDLSFLDMSVVDFNGLGHQFHRRRDMVSHQEPPVAQNAWVGWIFGTLLLGGVANHKKGHNGRYLVSFHDGFAWSCGAQHCSSDLN